MYQKAIVTFVDILGFGDFVQKSDYKAVEKVLDAVEESTSPIILDELDNEGDNTEVVSFSDSIVRVRKIESEANKKYPTGVLFQELLSLVHAQVELIDLNIIIRGGVTIGDIFISEGRVFGPGLVEAYSLENKYAKYPRIVIDPKLVYEYKTNELLRARWHRLEEEREIVSGLIKQSDDGMWFIDYARAVKSEVDEPEYYFDFLQKHRNVILAGAKNHKKLNAILSKFVWMAHYHNQIISDISDKWFEKYGLNKKKYSISSDEIPALQYMDS
jgi:hypothetical protein